MKKLTLTRNAALGNGNRKAGLVLGLFSGELGDVNDAIRCSSLAEVEAATGAKIGAADGVEEVEIITALVNGLFKVSTVKDSEPVEAVAVGEPNKPSEDAEPEEPTDLEDPGTEPVASELDSLDLTPALVERLNDAGLDTIAKIIMFGNDNDGLESIDGISSGETT